jgi:hypothetical protein
MLGEGAGLSAHKEALTTAVEASSKPKRPPSPLASPRKRFRSSSGSSPHRLSTIFEFRGQPKAPRGVEVQFDIKPLFAKPGQRQETTNAFSLAALGAEVPSPPAGELIETAVPVAIGSR